MDRITVPYNRGSGFIQRGRDDRFLGVELKIGSADRTTRAYQWRLRQLFVDVTGSLRSSAASK
jgi:hypothetical protein